MPVPGFSVLFVLVAVSAVVSALVAGSLLYRYQLQKEHIAAQAQSAGAVPLNTFASWMGVQLMRMRHGVATRPPTDANGTSSINGKTEEVRARE